MTLRAVSLEKLPCHVDFPLISSITLFFSIAKCAESILMLCIGSYFRYDIYIFFIQSENPKNKISDLATMKSALFQNSYVMGKPKRDSHSATQNRVLSDERTFVDLGYPIIKNGPKTSFKKGLLMMFIKFF